MLVTVRVLPVAAPAARYVAAAMRSGITRCSQPERRGTPSTVMVLSPAPEIRAPQETRKSARSQISGSRAALLMTVVPSAKTAAIRIFSVAPTLGNASEIAVPCKPFGTVQSSWPWSSRMTTPMRRSAER